MFELTSKVAVVTGGSRGIGKGICNALVKQGAAVAILDILDEEANKTVSEIQAAKGKAKFYHCDVTDKEAVDKNIAAIIGEFKQIDILVNCAGFDRIELSDCICCT